MQYPLRRVILDQQMRADRLVFGVAAKEGEIIRAEVVVIVQLEGEAELRYAGAVDMDKGGGVERRPVPARHRVVLNYANRGQRGGSLKIGDLKRLEIEWTEGAKHPANIHKDVAVCGERVRADHALNFQHQDGLRNDRVIGQVLGGEM